MRPARGKSTQNTRGGYSEHTQTRAIDNQRKKWCVKPILGISDVLGGLVLIWGSCYVWRPAWLVSASAWRSGLAAGMRQFRAGNEPFRSAVAVPVTRVFSPYVVQAGWARPQVRAGLLLQRSTGLVRRSGRPGESCPGLSAR